MEFVTEVMVRHGFSTTESKWWHFDDINWERYLLINMRPEVLRLVNKLTPREKLPIRR